MDPSAAASCCHLPPDPCSSREEPWDWRPRRQWTTYWACRPRTSVLYASGNTTGRAWASSCWLSVFPVHFGADQSDFSSFSEDLAASHRCSWSGPRPMISPWRSWRRIGTSSGPGCCGGAARYFLLSDELQLVVEPTLCRLRPRWSNESLTLSIKLKYYIWLIGTFKFN